MVADSACVCGFVAMRCSGEQAEEQIRLAAGATLKVDAADQPSITSMITAFSEQIITIDELRARMPDLRARETGLKDQIGSLDAQAADRDAYLRLAEGLEGFPARRTPGPHPPDHRGRQPGTVNPTEPEP
jgi:hypothetical protein